jgi:hypothetical protein
VPPRSGRRALEWPAEVARAGVLTAVTAVITVAPAPWDIAAGVPSALSDRMPTAMRAATRSVRADPTAGAPARTWAMTARVSWAQQMAQAAQATRASTTRSVCVSELQCRPDVDDQGAPIRISSTAGTPPTTTSAVMTDPSTSRTGRRRWTPGDLATGRLDVERVVDDAGVILPFAQGGQTVSTALLEHHRHRARSGLRLLAIGT